MTLPNPMQWTVHVNMTPKLQLTPLAHEIHELLDIPLHRGYYPYVGMKIIRSMIQAMTKALQRGESISVSGFGKLEVINRPPRVTHRVARHRDNSLGLHHPPNFSDTPYTTPAKKGIKFRPAVGLMAMLNHATPNYRERIAISNWTT